MRFMYYQELKNYLKRFNIGNEVQMNIPFFGGYLSLKFDVCSGNRFIIKSAASNITGRFFEEDITDGILDIDTVVQEICNLLDVLDKESRCVDSRIINIKPSVNVVAV